LSLLNVALESGGDEISRSDDLISVIQDDICKSLLQNSRTSSLSVLSLTLRAIFNLFLHFKRHLKVQLEIFFTSVHLKIAAMETASYEQREIALESLLEFCREPELMLELYENYDCDVRCTNLFETLVRFLVTNAFPSDGLQGVTGGFSTLHRLALSGLVSILHSIALRCEGQRHYRVEGSTDLSSPTLNAPETDLQRKREQKRRLILAARTFNSEPSKAMPALQSLGLVSTPPTPESMAEFLRHTPGLDLRIVGEYLAKRHEFNGQVRKAFLELFPFAGLGIVDGLRALLSTFRLPGESQLIERLMESFAEAYFAKQPPVLEGGEAGAGQESHKTARWVPREKNAEEAGEPSRVKMLSSDTIFILSYSIIMLNTDLHSAKVAKKMTAAEFIRNNRGIDNGKDMPGFFLTDIYEAIRDEEIRLHGDAPVEGGGGDQNPEVDDFFWEGILRRSESIDEFSTTERLLSETPPGASERDMLQVITDCDPLPMFSLCYESISDPAVSSQAMLGLQDMVKLSAYFDQIEGVSGLVKVMCQYFLKASANGSLAAKSQVALRALLPCIMGNLSSLREAEWRLVLETVVRLWALDLLPSHLTELDDFAGADGRPLESLGSLRPPYPSPSSEAAGQANQVTPEDTGTNRQVNQPPLRQTRQDSAGDGFFESLTKWFEDETRDTEEENLALARQTQEMSLGNLFPEINHKGMADSELPVLSSDVAEVHAAVKAFIAKSNFLELFTPSGTARLPAESWQALARSAAQLSKPSGWALGPSGSPTSSDSGSRSAVPPVPPGPEADWHDVVDPIFGLELLTNMTCMPHGTSQSLSQIWPLVSTHFERLILYIVGGHGSRDQQFIERLIVNTLRLCIRLIGNVELVPTLLMLTQHLARLPEGLFNIYSERIACGLLVLVKESDLQHTGLCAIFSLLRRISESPASVGACGAGLECLNHWLADDVELSRLLSMQHFPELLSTLKAFASQNSTPPAAAAALGQLSSLVPQMARGARNLPQKSGQWQSLWVPTLHALADVARQGSQKSSAQAFVYLQRLLLEQGTELSLPWEEVEFSVWKECMEQVLLPLLQKPAAAVDSEAVGSPTPSTSADWAAARRASAAQLICRVVLTHMPDWLRRAPSGFPILFLRLLHILVSEAAEPGESQEGLQESLKNLLLVVSADPVFLELGSPNQGESLLQSSWAVVDPILPALRREIALILDPSAGLPEEAAEGAA